MDPFPYPLERLYFLFSFLSCLRGKGSFSSPFSQDEEG